MRTWTMRVNTNIVSDHSQGATDDLTIEELADAAGVPVSTVRMYQHRGLLAPPERRGRVGWYGPGHRTRLDLIARLQERGFSLAAIKELIAGVERGESLRAVLGLGEGPSTWTAEEPVTLPLAELVALFPRLEASPELASRVFALGLVELGPEPGQVVVRSPAFLRIGRELAALGVPAEVIIDQYEQLRVEAEAVATRFTDVFRTHLWAPFVAAGAPPAGAAALVEQLEALGPLAEGVVVTTLRHALQEQAEAFIRTQAEALGLDLPTPGTPAEG